ncbi:DUF2775 family protein [Medicago truncatula]|uniref:DUF2775 family protein n=2 Tax=Medicago truncatula TaxID=3880 RepID=G7JG36_MEDTR|nr:DUF2775 family protein [Medicago truncatula]
MKSIFASFILFSLLLVADLSYARKDLGGYWKNMMNDQPMPEAIKELVQNQEVSDDFIRDFDVKPNVILYHTHVESKKKKEHVFVKNSQQELHGT